MASRNSHLSALLTVIAFLDTASCSNYEFGDSLCKLLEEKYVASLPWSAYPIVYEPINRGRLRIWTGVSTLPSSEFECYTKPNVTDTIFLDFTSFANKLEWTFYERSKGSIHHGFSVDYRDVVRFQVKIVNNQKRSYLDCNTIESIKSLDENGGDSSHRIQTICNDCGQAALSMIDGQVKELIKFKMNDQIIENLYWHLSQLITNQHYSNPTSMVD